MSASKVFEWLNKTGFPLEMAAAAAMRRAGFEVRQSFTYADSQSDKGREIDVLAKADDPLGVIDVWIALECKSSANPWVVLRSSEAMLNVNPLRRFSVMSEAATDALVKRIGNFGLLAQYIPGPAEGGYGFRQVFGKDSDPAYGAAICALKAAHGIVRERTTGTTQRYTFCFPAIVVDSPLYECSLQASGDLSLVEVGSSSFAFSAWIPELVATTIQVVTQGHLDKFGMEAAALAKRIKDELRAEESNAF